MASLEQKEIKSTQLLENIANSKSRLEESTRDKGKDLNVTGSAKMTSLTTMVCIPSSLDQNNVVNLDDDKEDSSSSAKTEKSSTQAYSELQDRCADMKASLTTLREQVSAMNSGSDGILQAAIMQLQLQQTNQIPFESNSESSCPSHTYSYCINIYC